MSEIFEHNSEFSATKTVLSELQLDQIVNEMTERAYRAAQNTRLVVDDVALLQDTLQGMGLTTEDVSKAQISMLEEIENKLFAEYLSDHEEL